jgi:hypothetical protein
MSNYNMYHYPGQAVPPGQYAYSHNWTPEDQKHQGVIPSMPSQPTLQQQPSVVPPTLIKDFMAIIKKGNEQEITSFMG